MKRTKVLEKIEHAIIDYYLADKSFVIKWGRSVMPNLELLPVLRFSEYVPGQVE
jgi:hypothetical protein